MRRHILIEKKKSSLKMIYKAIGYENYATTDPGADTE